MRKVHLCRLQMYRVCLVLWLSFFVSYAYSNVETISVGTGTATGKYLPMEPYYGFSYTQSIFTQSELNVSNSYISSISYHFVNTNGESSSFSDDVVIYIGHTSKTAFTSSSDFISSSDMSMVYNGKITVNEADQWTTIYLDTPFLYNNVDNLVVAFDENSSGFHDNKDEFYCHATSENSSICYYNDNTNSDPSNPENGSITNYRPNIRLNFDTYTCEAVLDVVITKTTDTEINVSWSLLDKEQTDWIIEYGEHGFTPGEGNVIEATTNSGTAIGDLTNGIYDLYVKANCGNNDYSGYHGKIQFYIFDMDGEGTEENPYEITSLADLSLLTKITDYWSYAFIMTTDVDAAETETSDYYNNGGMGLSPIGNAHIPFTGSFDGNSHVISNLYINSSTEYTGLFGYVGAGATIKNLGLENASVTSTSYYSYAGVLVGQTYGTYSNQVAVSNCYTVGGLLNARNYAGAFIGHVSYTTCTNCYATTEVNTSANYVGGFTGYIQYSSQFVNCYASGSVTGSSYVGAFTGYNSEGSFENCYFDQESSTLAYGGSNDNYSGLSGLNTQDFASSENFLNWDFDPIIGDWQMGALDSDIYTRPRLIWQTVDTNICVTPLNVSVTALTNTSARVDWIEMGSSTEWTIEYGEHGFTQGEGEVIIVTGEEGGNITGLSYPKVYDIYVSSSCGNTSKAIVYVNFSEAGSGTTEDPYKISNMADLDLLSHSCEVWNANYMMTANIEAKGTDTSEVYNNDGYGYTPIGNSEVHFTGSFDGNGYVISNIYIYSSSDNLGLFGYVGAGAVLKNIGLYAPIIDPYNTNSYYIGTLAGYVEGKYDNRVNIENCFSLNGDVKGYQYVGGMLGIAYYTDISDCYANNVVAAENKYVGGFVGNSNYQAYYENCYSAGSVSGDSFIGGFSGNFSSYASFTNCYFDTETSGQAYASNSVDVNGITGLKTSDFESEDIFTNWDFTNTWVVCKIFNEDVLRPRFQSQMRTLTIGVSGNGTTLPATGIYNFTKGEPIKVIATASGDDEFILWTQNNVDYSTEATYAVNSFDNDVEIVANFTDETTGIKEATNEIFNVYPNPACSVIYIEGNEILDATIQIVTVSGSLVLSQKVTSNIEQLDISRLNEGAYFVIIKFNHVVYQKKWVKI